MMCLRTIMRDLYSIRECKEDFHAKRREKCIYEETTANSSA